ncbi:hypothetical protein ILUMI_01450 [Ignelater luminosus]|uniref:Odorant receptor n=1 Tax=Ignelater luminosus TaxID=2038154 RepID=A0A8K0GP78_IGNLU|nr:hypothetical protein ILUMI_01450 [Ignelater luminosus]
MASETTKTHLDVQIPETLKQPFAGMKKLGLFSKNGLRKIITTSVSLSTLIVYLAILALQFKNIKSEVSEYVNNLEVLLGGFQVIARIITLALREEEFAQLINNIQEFWNPNECDESTKNEITLIHNLILHMQKSLLLVTGSAIIFALLSPLFGNSLPLGIWTFEGHHILYRFMLIISQFVAAFAGIYAYCFDCTYLAFSAEIVIQFKILSYHLEHLVVNDSGILKDGKDYLDEMRNSFSRHRFVNKFQSLYSTMLLIEYFTICPLICLELYAATESSTVPNIVRYATSGGMVTMQLVFYCIPANFIADEGWRGKRGGEEEEEKKIKRRSKREGRERQDKRKRAGGIGEEEKRAKGLFCQFVLRYQEPDFHCKTRWHQWRGKEKLKKQKEV